MSSAPPIKNNFFNHWETLSGTCTRHGNLLILALNTVHICILCFVAYFSLMDEVSSYILLMSVETSQIRGHFSRTDKLVVI